MLDLGCGLGRDCYLLSRLVGKTGRVIGVDMTEEQLSVARNHLDWHTERYSYNRANVEFLHGHIEDLSTVGIVDNSIDVVVSNCVINLSANKHKVLSEIFRVLKPGGELYFSDVYADRRIPEALKLDPVLLGECLGGALYWEDFRRIMQEIGCPVCRPKWHARPCLHWRLPAMVTPKHGLTRPVLPSRPKGRRLPGRYAKATIARCQPGHWLSAMLHIPGAKFGLSCANRRRALGLIFPLGVYVKMPT